MADEKKYSAQEAALAVLAKAQEVLAKSELIKAEHKHKHIGWDKLHSKLEGEGYSKESADKIAGSIKAEVHPSHKSENMDKSQGYPTERYEGQKGVHEVMPTHEKGKGVSHGNSSAGLAVARGNKAGQSGTPLSGQTKQNFIDYSKARHGNKLEELKSMPKPNLTKDEQPVGEIHPKEHIEGEAEKPGERIKDQKSPKDNPKEQAEGNNELAGTTPTQVGQDGKNMPGFDEMKGPLKLAHFIGYMAAKRKKKSAGA